MIVMRNWIDIEGIKFGKILDVYELIELVLKIYKYNRLCWC